MFVKNQLSQYPSLGVKKALRKPLIQLLPNLVQFTVVFMVPMSSERWGSIASPFSPKQCAAVVVVAVNFYKVECKNRSAMAMVSFSDTSEKYMSRFF